MSRVKTSFKKKKKRKKLFFLTKGFIGRRKNVYRIAKQAYLKSLIYSYRDRKKNKSKNREKWIEKINISLQYKNKKYNIFFNKLKEKNIKINRKMFFCIIKNKKKYFYKILNYLGC
ncbi:50S ribosomal protein L20 [Candidatus Vidania fulgoroideorum]